MQINEPFLDYYRCPERYASFAVAVGDADASNPGFSPLPSDPLLYGSVQSFPIDIQGDLSDCVKGMRIDGSRCILPFDASEVVNNLRYERYVSAGEREAQYTRFARRAYYLVRPCLPVSLRKHLQR